MPYDPNFIGPQQPEWRPPWDFARREGQEPPPWQPPPPPPSSYGPDYGGGGGGGSSFGGDDTLDSAPAGRPPEEPTDAFIGPMPPRYPGRLVPREAPLTPEERGEWWREGPFYEARRTSFAPQPLAPPRDISEQELARYRWWSGAPGGPLHEYYQRGPSRTLPPGGGFISAMTEPPNTVMPPSDIMRPQPTLGPDLNRGRYDYFTLDDARQLAKDFQWLTGRPMTEADFYDILRHYTAFVQNSPTNVPTWRVQTPGDILRWMWPRYGANVPVTRQQG